MTKSAIVRSHAASSRDAGDELADGIARVFESTRPDAVLVFASPQYDYRVLLATLTEKCGPRAMIGGSAIGGFVRGDYSERSAVAVALGASDMSFVATVARGLRANGAAVARELVSSFKGMSSNAYAFRSAIVLLDPRAAYAETFIQDLTVRTAGKYQLFGGGAADDVQIRGSHLFYGNEVLEDAAVALEILSNKPLGAGVCHGWVVNSPAMRVTESEGRRLISLNAMPAIEAFQQHAETTGQVFDIGNPIPFFLNNILGIDAGESMIFRVPIAAERDGSISFAADIFPDASVHIMHTSGALASEGAINAVRGAREQLGPHTPEIALFFDCLASRMRLQLGFGYDPHSLESALGTSQYVGFSTCGQIVRADGQFNGFQNCTSVVCVIPK